MAEYASDKESSASPSPPTGDPDSELLNTNLAHIPNGDPSLKASATQIHRNQFLKAAPSLMKLINVAQTPKPLQPLLDDEPFPDTEPPQRHSSRSHVKMPTVINNVMAEFGKQNDVNTELQELALKAAKEFQILTAKNDALFREKEQFRTKYDDITQTMQELQQKLSDTDVYRDENERLMTINSSLEVKMKVYAQEKAILEDNINELKSKRANSSSVTSDDTSTTNTVKSKNEERLMSQISLMMKEKNEMESAFESFKVDIDTKNKNISSLHQQLSNSQQEINRLNKNLNETTDKYVKLEQSKHNQRSRYDRKLTIQSDQMTDDYGKRQYELEKVIASQKKRIQELEGENREIQNYQYNRGKKNSGKMAHLRLRTKQDVFGGAEFDLDPFGPDAEEDAFMQQTPEPLSGRSDNDEDGQPTFHDVDEDEDGYIPRTSLEEEDGYIIPATHSQTASTQIIEVHNTKSCGCFTSWFNKMNKNKVKKLASAKPLAVQEIRD